MTKSKDNQTISDTETLIMKAAEREFMTKGFAGARTTSIAEAAGVTHAMFHYYFRTKEKLFDRIITEKNNLLREALVSSVGDENMTLDEMIRNVIEKHLEFLAANPDLPRFLVGEIFSNPERSSIFLDKLRAYAPAIIKFIQLKIDNEASTGLCRKVDAKMLLLDIVSLNIFAYMASPAVNAALGDCTVDSEKFLELRKKENYETIMSKLKP